LILLHVNKFGRQNQKVSLDAGQVLGSWRDNFGEPDHPLLIDLVAVV
jgi:hypothetical protein